MMIVTGHY